MPDVFWDLTCAEFYMMATGWRKRQIDRYNQQIYGAWYTAALMRQDRLSDLDKLLIPDEPKQKPDPQTPLQMINYLKILTAAMGGNYVEV